MMASRLSQIAAIAVSAAVLADVKIPL